MWIHHIPLGLASISFLSGLITLVPNIPRTEAMVMMNEGQPEMLSKSRAHFPIAMHKTELEDNSTDIRKARKQQLFFSGGLFISIAL